MRHYQQRAAPPPSDNVNEFVMSDQTVDRVGDVIMQDGWVLANFKKHPIALFNHDRDQVVGRWADVEVRKGRLMGRLELADEGTSPLVDSVRKLVKQKILRAVSVGFRPLKQEKLDDTADDFWGPFRFLETELLECSLVSIPANPNALSTAKALDIPRDLLTEVFREPALEDPARPSGKPPKSTSRKGVKPMQLTLSQKITNQQKEVTRLKDQLTELAGKDEPEADDLELIDAIPGEIENAEKELTRLQRVERALAPKAAGNGSDPDPEPVNSDFAFVGQVRGAEAAKRPAPFKKKLQPIDFLVRATAAQVIAFTSKEPLQKVLGERYRGDEQTAMVLKAATAPATTTAVGWAAELVETVNAEFLDLLRPASIYGPLSARGARFTFGRAGAIKIPGRAATPTVAGSWVGEGAPKPVRKLAFTAVTLSPHKLAVISLFTEEIGEHSTPAIEQIIRDAMRDDTATAIDTYLIDNVAASANRPAGLLNGLTTLTPSVEADPLAMVADLKALAAAVVAQGGGRDLVFLINPVQAMGIGFAQTTTGDFIFDGGTDQAGQKLNATFIVSNTVPADTVVCVDAADFASATGDVPRYSVSNEATVHREDTTPLPISSTGTPNTVAAPISSLWQEDLIGVRMTWPITWAMRRAGMVAFMSGVTW